MTQKLSSNEYPKIVIHPNFKNENQAHWNPAFMVVHSLHNIHIISI